jgi:sucrose-6-phosphate hydrolase SacC (GH32 family)
MMNEDSKYGYLLVHFVENAQGHGEKIYLSLSRGDDPLSWRRLNEGEAVLESSRGTTGVRDPHLVRRHDGSGFHIIATDLRVWTGAPDIDWDRLSRFGSRDLVMWDSPDLVHWSVPRYVTVAPPEAGMAWAPEAHYDADAGTYLVYWSSKMYDDAEHSGDSYSRILVARTDDFRTFSPAEIYLDTGAEAIDMTVALTDGGVHRFVKDNSVSAHGVFQEALPSFFAGGARWVAEKLGHQFANPQAVEAPLVFHDNRQPDRWYLWVDQFERQPQGYCALTTTDIESGQWDAVPAGELDLPPNTKHGTVLPLTAEEWERVDAAL